MSAIGISCFPRFVATLGATSTCEAEHLGDVGAPQVLGQCDAFLRPVRDLALEDRRAAASLLTPDTIPPERVDH